MNLAQKAVLQSAIDAGKLPMEQSAEFMLHDLVQACIDQLRAQSKLFSEQSEQQQDSVIAKLQSDLKETVYAAARILAGAQVIEVPLQLVKLDTAKELKLTGTIGSDDPGRHQLMDMAHKKQKVLILLHDMNYFQGLDGIQSDKDQKALPLDDTPAPAGKGGKGKTAPKVESPTSAKAIATKPIELPEKLVADAIEFVKKQQVCGASSLQNHLKIGGPKAKAVQAKLAELGHIALDDKGEYQIVRVTKVETEGTGSTAGAGSTPLSFDDDDVPQVAQVLTDELYAEIKTKVILDGRVSVGALAVAFDIETDLVETAIDRLELDGVISPVDDELGTRTVLTQDE